MPRAFALGCLVLAAVALAGCSDVPNGTVRTNATWADRSPTPMPYGITWASFAGGVLELPTGGSATLPVDLPNSTDGVIVNLTFLDGATVAPRAMLGSCSWENEATWVGTGQTVGFGCDEMAAGKLDLTVSHRGPPSRVRAEVAGVLRLCATSTPC